MENTILFCANCTWEIVPMLLGAWLLGTAFWWLLKGNAMSTQIKELSTSETLLKEQGTKLQFDLDTKSYELDKLQTNHKDLKTRFGELELKWRAAKEQLDSWKKD